ncbi:MAG: Formyl-CoA transferase [Ramlibacter sp.]|nr:Formyl-CoA transferase [Ramlibacter sp.]
MSSKPAASGGPLSGVRILDLTAVVLGPMATQILGDYGAEIIKVEPVQGDVMRANGVSLHRGMSSIFLAINRNKQSIALDLKRPEGVEALRRLVPTVDVFIHNMRVSALNKLGFGYEAVAKLKPDIVYCAATGFGQDGPYRDQPAFDDIIQAASGMVAFGSDTDRQYLPSLVADKTAGLALVNAVLAALFHRERTGVGQYVEVPMLETVTSFVLAEHLGGLTFEPQAGPAGYARLLDGGRKPVRTLDGFVATLPYTAANWISFFNEIGQPQLVEALGVVDPFTRNKNVVALYAKVQEYAADRTTAQMMEMCERLDIPATPIYGIEQLPEHPHLKAVGLFQMADHPTEGRIRYVRPPTIFSSTPAAVRCQAPLLGQDTVAVLGQAGFSSEEISRLLAQGVAKQSGEGVDG